MSPTSAQLANARYYKEYLQTLRAEESRLLRRFEESQATFGNDEEAFASIKAVYDHNIAEVRAHIASTKEILATKDHIKTKAEARKARQAAAKGRTGRKSKSK